MSKYAGRRFGTPSSKMQAYTSLECNMELTNEGFLKYGYPHIIHFNGISIINPPFWSTPIHGTPQMNMSTSCTIIFDAHFLDDYILYTRLEDFLGFGNLRKSETMLATALG